ncbi:N-acetylneuraminate synthase family protein [Cellulophaga fucicola]|uniref:N-acetylneuraminate synthase n=1 Tax=Cellulophaga fucicola TaxID=76595 RepID=A0A1K1QA37_9FLAO|nr:N-acetylneuraminate synthase family protein [Cellulophaga fucicola]SFW56569.1 N-acetylneuraminate synthase [Cellulophaga fucicola]
MENYLNQIKNILSELQTNKVYIVGKGPSLANINPDRLVDGVVFNLNDSERFYPGHFSILHSFWAFQSVQQNEFKSKCYISDRSFPEHINSIKLEYEPDNYESFNSISSSLLSKPVVISDFLFITAIQLVLYTARTLNIKLDVYFLGFDFGDANTVKIVEDHSGHSKALADAILHTQEDLFKSVKSYIDKNFASLNVIHVGEKIYSKTSVFKFNKESIKEDYKYKTNIELYEDIKLQIANNIPVVVAELTNNHIGDEERLRTMIRLSKEQGADMIKVQKRDVSTFYTKEELESDYNSPFGKTLKDYRESVELTDYLFEVLIEECKLNEICWFTSILDKNSYDYILKYDPPLIKLPSTISNHRNYLSLVAETFTGDVVVSTGFTDKEYESFVLQSFNKSNNLFLLQCTSSYPAPPESCNIAVINHYNNLKISDYDNIIPGYSSHDVGPLASQMAVSAGALMLEKHVKFGNLDWIHFDGVALDLTKGELANYVKEIKKAVTINGSKDKKPQKAEHHKYKINSKSN